MSNKIIHTDFLNNIGMPNTAANAMQNYTQQFRYDELGNILQMKSVGKWTRDYYYNFADNNYLQGHTVNSTEYTYDQHGNMLSMPHLNSMLWDYKDELKEVVLNANNDKAYYVYDSTGERVRKVIKKGNIVEERYYLGDYELYRKTTNNTVNVERTTVHVSDDQKRIAMVDNDGTNETIRYQYDNHLGSASLELDHNANIISYEEYHPFGTTSYRSGRTETEVSQKRYKYTGKERDNETGLYYYGARYYATWIARFISVDPLQFDYPQLTPYNYAGNKPITHLDIDGMQGTGDKKIINTNYIPSPIVNDKTNYVNPYKIYHQANKSQSNNEVISPEIRNIQGRIEGFVKALKSGVDLSQATLQEAKNKYITDVVGNLYLKQGDARLKVSKNRMLNPDDIPFNKMTGRHTRMTDDLSRTHKSFRNIGRGMDAAFFAYDIFKYVSSDSFQEKGAAAYDLGMDVLSLGSGYIHPALGAIIGFGDMVMSSSDFKNQMLNYYKGEMDKYKHNNSSKFKNAEDNYYKYYKQIRGNRSENAQDKQLYFNPKQ